MNLRRLTDRILHSHVLVLTATLLGGLAMLLGLLWMLGQPTQVAAAPAAKKALNPAQEPTEKPLQAPLQASGWTTRTEITIHYSSTTPLADYQISMTIPYSTGMQDDFDDLRFGDTDGNCLGYWVESITGTAPSTTATIWVKIPSIVSPTTTVYMYYGNSSVSSASDGRATFEFFDDFEDPAWSDQHWDDYYENNGSFDVDGGIATLNSTNRQAYALCPYTGEDYIVEAKTKHESSPGPAMGLVARADDKGNLYHQEIDENDLEIYKFDNWIYDNLAVQGLSSVLADTWYHVLFRVNGTSLHARSFYHGASISATDTDYSSGYAGIEVHSETGCFDDFRVRKYASKVPTTTLGSPARVSDLAIVKSVRSTTITPTLVNAGDPVTYTITFTNENGSDVTGVVITDIVPVSVTNTSVVSSCTTAITQTNGAPTYTWDVADLATGASCVITISGEVSTTLSGGDEFANMVTAAEGSGGCPCNNSDSVAVTVNHYPTADATASPEDINLCGTSALDGTGSSDVEDPTSLSYQWTQTGGPDIEGIDDPFTDTTSFTGSCTHEGVVTLTLTVTDTGGLTDTAEVTVTVKNVPVDGLSIADSSTTTLGCTTYFTAEITDGSSVTYTWNFNDGYITETDDIAHVSYIDHIYAPSCVTEPVTYTVWVTASNRPTDTTYTDITTTVVTITNQAPIAVAGVAPPVDRYQQAVIDSLVTLDGSDSHDPDVSCHDIAEYHWEQIGGFTATLSDKSAISPTFTAPSPPTLPTVITFTLTVTDSGCLTDSDLVTITLVPPVGGHTAPMDAQALLWPWAALIAVLGAAAVVTAAALRRRTTETSASTR